MWKPGGPPEQGTCERCGAWLPLRPDTWKFESFLQETHRSECEHCRRSSKAVWSPFTVDNTYCEHCRVDELVEQWRYRFSCLACGWPAERVDKRPMEVLFAGPLEEIHQPGSPRSMAWWHLPPSLIVLVNDAAARYARPVAGDELSHRPSLLDHGGRRLARWGTVYEDPGDDPHRVRLSLARLRHARRETEDARAAWRLAERAVLAVNLLYARSAKLLEPFREGDPSTPRRVAPVLGGGGLGIEGRYTAWIKKHNAWPWLFDPEETWQYRMRRRFAGLPDPEIEVAPVPKVLEPLLQFIDVADDFELWLSHRRPPSPAVLRGTEDRFAVFMSLSWRGYLTSVLPYVPEAREPGYVSSYMRGMEDQYL